MPIVTSAGRLCAIALCLCLPLASPAATFDYERTLLNPRDTRNDRLGLELDIDDGRVLVGRNSDDQGVDRVDLLDAETGAVLQTFIDPTPNSPTINQPSRTTQFGSTGVSIEGDLIAIGALAARTDGRNARGIVHIYDAGTDTPRYSLTSSDANNRLGFGRDVIIGDGIIAVSSTDAISGDGAVEIFDADTGQHLRTVSSPDGPARDGFGRKLAIDDGKLLVGTLDSFDDGGAYLFDIATGGLVARYDDPTAPEDPARRDFFGSDVALAGNRALIGAQLEFDADSRQFVGGAYLFDALTGDLVTQLQAPAGVQTSQFGNRVLLTEDYAFVSSGTFNPAVGSRGAVFVYDAADGSYLTQMDNPHVEDLSAGANGSTTFGFGAIGFDGEFFVVGDYQYDLERQPLQTVNNNGAVQVFRNTLPQVIPVPASAPLLGAALLLGGLVARRSRR